MTFCQRACALGVAAGLLVADGPVRAQGMYLWSVDELKAKSDLVVVAKVTGTRDTGVKTSVNSLPVIEVKTDFKVLSVMKGNATTAFSLRHDRLDMVALHGGCVDCGTQLDFTATSRSAMRCREGKSPVPAENICEYLMFLRRDPDGVFVPTSGQLFPTDSVFVLSSPLVCSASGC